MTPPDLKAAQADLAFRQYSNALQMTLSDFQFIEESLRLYLTVAYEFVRHRLGDTLPFKFTADDLEKDALGRLIDKFAKFSNNTELVAELRALQPIRNEIAHRGLLLSIEELHDADYLDEQRERLNELHLKARKPLQALLNERAKLTGEKEVNLGDPS